MHSLLCALPCQRDEGTRPRPGGQLDSLPVLRRGAWLQHSGDAQTPGGDLASRTARVLWLHRGRSIGWRIYLRGVTLFPSSIEDIVRRIPTLGAEFAIVLTKERDLDVLIVQVEAVAEVPTERYAEIVALVEREIRSQCELRAVIEVLPQGTLPPTQFKAKRVRDSR